MVDGAFQPPHRTRHKHTLQSARQRQHEYFDGYAKEDRRGPATDGHGRVQSNRVSANVIGVRRSHTKARCRTPTTIYAVSVQCVCVLDSFVLLGGRQTCDDDCNTCGRHRWVNAMHTSSFSRSSINLFYNAARRSTEAWAIHTSPHRRTQRGRTMGTDNYKQNEQPSACFRA